MAACIRCGASLLDRGEGKRTPGAAAVGRLSTGFERKQTLSVHPSSATDSGWGLGEVLNFRFLTSKMGVVFAGLLEGLK